MPITRIKDLESAKPLLKRFSDFQFPVDIEDPNLTLKLSGQDIFDLIGSSGIDGSKALSELEDTTISEPVDGDFLQYFLGKWINKSLSYSDISGLAEELDKKYNKTGGTIEGDVVINGNLKVLGSGAFHSIGDDPGGAGGGGSGLDYDALKNLLTGVNGTPFNIATSFLGSVNKNFITATLGSNAYAAYRSDYVYSGDSRLVDARRASDVYAWAKAAVKPSYTWTEIGGKPSTFTPSAHSHAVADVPGVWHIGNFNPDLKYDKTGGTISGDVIIEGNLIVKGNGVFHEMGSDPGGEGDGSGLDYEALKNLLTGVNGTPFNIATSFLGSVNKNFITATLGSNAYAAYRSDYVYSGDSRLVDARRASDVYAWAKAAVKPGYDISEISGDTYRFVKHIDVSDIYNFSAIGNKTGAYQVAQGGYSTSLWQFYVGGSMSALQIYRDAYYADSGSLFWRNTIDGNRFSSEDGRFRRFWDSVNFDPNTKYDKTGGVITGDIHLSLGDIIGSRAIISKIGETYTGGIYFNRSVASSRWTQLDFHTQGYDGYVRRLEVGQGLFKFSGSDVWYAGNSNLPSSDWACRNLTAHGGSVRVNNGSSFGTYIELAKYNGSMPDVYPGVAAPVIKTDFDFIYFSTINKYRGSIGVAGDGNAELSLVSSAGTGVVIRTGGNSFVNRFGGRFGIGTSSPREALEVAGNAMAKNLKLTGDSGLMTTIGSLNARYCHYSTEALVHWFNKSLNVLGDVYAGEAYNRRLAYADQVSGEYHYMIDATGLNQDTYYPVVIGLSGTVITTKIAVYAYLGNSSVPSWATHDSGFNVRFREEVNAAGWGAATVSRSILEHSYAWASRKPIGKVWQMAYSSTEVIWILGGGRYEFVTSLESAPEIKTSAFTANSQTVAPESYASLASYNLCSSAEGAVGFSSTTTKSLYVKYDDYSQLWMGNDSLGAFMEYNVSGVTKSQVRMNLDGSITLYPSNGIIRVKGSVIAEGGITAMEI